MALWRVWWQLRERGPDVVEHLLPPSDTGSDRHHRSGRFPPGPQPDLLQAAGAQRGDPRHDPPRSGLPGSHNLPPRLQRLRDQSLTGTQEPPSPSFPTYVSPIISTSDSPSTTSASITTAHDECPSRRGPAPTHVAPPSSSVSAAQTAQLQMDTFILPSPSAEPEHLDHFPRPPDLFSSQSCTKTPDFSLPCTEAPRRSYLDENIYCPFRGHSSHSSPLLHLHSSARPVSSNFLQTVASEPTLIAPSHTNPLPIPPQGSHLPHFPQSTYKQPGPSAALHPEHPPVLTSPTPSSSVLTPRPPSLCPAAPEQTVAWGCCCTLSGAAAPLTHYLGKVGHAALPLLKAGGLLKSEPSDVQTWEDREILCKYKMPGTNDCRVDVRNAEKTRRHSRQWWDVSLNLLDPAYSCLLKHDLMWFLSEHIAATCKIALLIQVLLDGRWSASNLLLIWGRVKAFSADLSFPEELLNWLNLTDCRCLLQDEQRLLNIVETACDAAWHHWRNFYLLH